MAKRAAAIASTGLLALASIAGPARATSNPLLLFGGPEQREFLGCLNCDATEPYSIWNAASEFGDPERPLCIWNRKGPYGSTESPHSPWSERPQTLPVVVDRAGNFWGYFAADPQVRGRVTDGYLVWLLEARTWIADHLDVLREEWRP
jgi:hypothetical protein